MNLISDLKSTEQRLQASEKEEHRLSDKLKEMIDENASLKLKMEDQFRVEYLEQEKKELSDKLEEQGAIMEELSVKVQRLKHENETLKEIREDQEQRLEEQKRELKVMKKEKDGAEAMCQKLEREKMMIREQCGREVDQMSSEIELVKEKFKGERRQDSDSLESEITRHLETKSLLAASDRKVRSLTDDLDSLRLTLNDLNSKLKSKDESIRKLEETVRTIEFEKNDTEKKCRWKLKLFGSKLIGLLKQLKELKKGEKELQGLKGELRKFSDSQMQMIGQELTDKITQFVRMKQANAEDYKTRVEVKLSEKERKHEVELKTVNRQLEKQDEEMLRLKTEFRGQQSEKDRIAGECAQLRKMLDKTKMGETEWVDKVGRLEEKLGRANVALQDEKSAHETALASLLKEIEKQRSVSRESIDDLEKENQRMEEKH